MIEKRSAHSYKEISKIGLIIEKEIWNKRVRKFFEVWVKHSFFRLEYTRLIKIDDEIASFVMFIPEEMKIGSAIVKIGWLEFSFTRKKYRSKGFFTEIFKDLLKYSSRLGYPWIKIYGRVDLYSKFGFVPCFYHSLISVPVINIRNKGGSCSVKKFRQSYIEPVIKLTQINNHNEVYYPLRPKESWGSIVRYHPDRKGLYILENKANHKVVGYMWMKSPRNNMLWVEELEVVDKETSESLLALCAKMAKRNRVERICFPISVNSFFGQYCQQGLGAEINLSVGNSEGNRFGCEDMIKILNAHELLLQLKPELERRWLNSKYKDWVGTVTIKTDSDIVNLEIEKSQIKINSDIRVTNSWVKLPDILFAQLVIGFKDINEIAKEPRVIISPCQLDLISTLFPKLYPHTITKEFSVNAKPKFFRDQLRNLLNRWHILDKIKIMLGK